MRERILDGSKIAGREELHAFLSRELSFPPYYGKTLDALLDCLTELSEDTVLLLLHREALEQSLGSYARTLLTVLGRAATENPHFHFFSEEAPSCFANSTD